MTKILTGIFVFFGIGLASNAYAQMTSNDASNSLKMAGNVTFIPGGAPASGVIDYKSAVPLPMPSSVGSPGVTSLDNASAVATQTGQAGFSVGSGGSGKLDLKSKF
ncbi:hypothetical protein [Methylobacterium sp. J-077]|uniref:hypothetical protein n=1 Tax=Methylobacterium sp. J-077 TaxID=2836656 RepID=UPI001FB918F7|nr:hypothetical protein [Methylobacterium sp. J-077]MCJ2121799.1 hypothetical protein [Methylobacterium sp. J-077]